MEATTILNIILVIIASILATAILSYLLNTLVSTRAMSTKDLEIKIEEALSQQENLQVFLSYADVDQKLASKLAEDLRAKEIEVWMTSEQLQIGDSISQKIEEGIISSHWVIVLVSQDSSKSKLLQQEIDLALLSEQERERTFVLPVIYQDTEIPDQLQDKAYADLSDYTVGFNKLIARLKPTESVAGSLVGVN